METEIKQHYWLIVYEIYSHEGVMTGKGNFTHSTNCRVFTHISHESCMNHVKGKGNGNHLIVGVNYLGEMTEKEAYGDGNS